MPFLVLGFLSDFLLAAEVRFHAWKRTRKKRVKKGCKTALAYVSGRGFIEATENVGKEPGRSFK